jgi:hypothetical protein
LTLNTGNALNNDVVTVAGSGGVLSSIQGAVTINNGHGASVVTVSDVLDTTVHNPVTLDGTSLTGLSPGPINFGANSLHGLTITGGSGHDTWTVVNTPGSRAPGGDPVALNTGNLNDVVTVPAEDPTAPLTVNGARRLEAVTLG